MEEPIPTKAPADEWPGKKFAWTLVALACVVVALTRWRLRGIPLERDEGEYAYFGQLILRGFPPFHLAYSLKLPGTQLAYAAIMAVFGQSTAGIRNGLVLVNAATTALLFLLGRKLLGTLGGIAVAIAFAFLSLEGAILGPFAHATHFVVLPAVAGLLVLLRATEKKSLGSFVASGLLLGLAFLMKQQGGVYLLFALAWLAWSRLRGKAARRLLAEAAALFAGAALPLALVILWTLAGGSFEQFWFWVVQYGREYTTSPSIHYAIDLFSQAASGIFEEGWFLWLLAGGGLLAAAASPGWPSDTRVFLLGLSAFSFLGVSIGFYYRAHYFILALPAAGLLVGGFTRFSVERARENRTRLVAGIALAAVAFGCVQTGLAQRRTLFELSQSQASRTLCGLNPFPEAPEIARYIASRTRPEDWIAVIGSEPEILFYAKRRSATGHVYTYGLMEPQPFARVMQEQMAHEIESARPAYLVWVLMPVSWLMKATSDPWILGWAQEYVSREYELVGEVEILDIERTEYYWDDFATQAPGLAPNRLAVFRRRDFTPLPTRLSPKVKVSMERVAARVRTRRARPR